MVPEGWELLPIGDAGEVRGGRQRSPKYTDGDSRPYLRVANVFDGFIDYGDVLEMRFTKTEFDRYKLQPGDILLNEGQSLELVGRSAIFDGPTETYAFQNTLVRFRPGRNTDSRFAHVLFQFLRQTGRFSRIATQTTSIAHLGTQRFANLVAPFPPPREQNAIAEILSTWDRAIEQTETLIAAKRRLKQGLMQQLLTGKRRFPEFGVPASDGTIPKDWKHTQLGEIASIKFSNVDKKTNGGEQPVRLCNYLDVYNNQYITANMPFMEATATTVEIAKFALQPGDVLITKDSETPDDIANAATVIEQMPGVICGYHLGILRPKHDVCGFFLGQLLMLPAVRYQFTRIANGATRFGLGLSSVAKVPLCLPPRAEQEKIAAVLMKLDHEIEWLSRSVEHFTHQKRGLMQKLLTGQVRVGV